MKRTVLFLTLTLLTTALFAQERTAIAVFPFEDMDNLFTQNESVLFYRRFSNEFVNKNNNKFRVIPRQDVEKLINTEAKFQLSDFSAKTKTAEMNRVLNGSQILSGYIGKLGSKVTVSISLYTYPDLEQLPGGVDIDVANKDELFTKMPDLVQSMMTAIAGGGTSTQPAYRQYRQNKPLRGRFEFVEGFVFVEGGTFQMGSPTNELGRSSDEVQHQVTVKSFYMSKYEVTQKEWHEVMGTTIRQQRDMADKSWSLYGEGDNYPMYYVNWYEAVEYCNKRSIKEGLTPAYRGSGDNITCDWNANGYRLPTEAEWEFAAKGGTKDLLTATYSGSNNKDAVAWHDGNSGKTTHPVGTKTANSLGIYDMSGNVWEWCWDLKDDYPGTSKPKSSQSDSKSGLDILPGLITDIAAASISARTAYYRVIRGGGYASLATFIRSANRNNNDPSSRSSTTGFRLVRN